MPLQKNLDEFNFSITSGCRKLLIFRISSGTLYILSHFFFTNSTELHALQTIIVLNYFQLAVKSLFIATPTRMTLTSPCSTDIYLKPLNARGGTILRPNPNGYPNPNSFREKIILLFVRTPVSVLLQTN